MLEVLKAVGALFAAIIALLTTWFLPGCSMPMFPRELGQSAQAIVTSMTDQAVWQDIASNVDGEVINPGVRGYVGVLYVAGGNLEGVSGRVSLKGVGTGSGQLSPEARAKILELIMSDTQMLHDAIDAIKGGVVHDEPKPLPPQTP